MKPIVLAAALPLALTACNFGLPGGKASNASIANAAAPEVVPDSVTVNGVTYVRAGLDKIAPVAAATTTPAPVATTASAPVSDTGVSVPPNTESGGDAGADHGN
jgi:hypothetical protein